MSSQSECDDVSTFHTVQKYSPEPLKQSSTLPPPNSAIRITFLMRAGRTFQQATQAQILRLCPNQGWPRHRLDKLANTLQNPASCTAQHRSARSSLGLPSSDETTTFFTVRRMSAVGTSRNSWRAKRSSRRSGPCQVFNIRDISARYSSVSTPIFDLNQIQNLERQNSLNES